MPERGRVRPWWAGELSRREVLKAGAVSGIGVAGLLQMKPGIRPALAQGGSQSPVGSWWYAAALFEAWTRTSRPGRRPSKSCIKPTTP